MGETSGPRAACLPTCTEQHRHRLLVVPASRLTKGFDGVVMGSPEWVTFARNCRHASLCCSSSFARSASLSCHLCSFACQKEREKIRVRLFIVVFYREVVVVFVVVGASTRLVKLINRQSEMTLTAREATTGKRRSQRTGRVVGNSLPSPGLR